MTSTDQPRSGSQAVERAIHLLNCFEGDDPEFSLSELAHLAGVPVSSAHRLAKALVRGRLLEQDPATDRYRVGAGLATLARPALTRLGIDSAAPHMYALAAGIKITASLSVIDAGDALTILQARPPVLFCHHQLPQPRQPLRSSAAGHALLAYAAVAGDRLPGRSTGPGNRLGPDLDLVRHKGFALAEIPEDDPLRAIAVPVFGPGRQVWGALSVQARSARLTDELVREILPAMQHFAVRIGSVVQNSSPGS
ncbi:IclR family transcriptional regulator [Nocardia sp. XZ_19_385]|uniref:IclR family transcriptional regulator n=1 Tax=Nocardia sp. XZ_19_385 TaxID=2769488 RepID=UPI0018903BC8|nr:IclR family transcriptional regulator [Nocardia sp. XZ_19_385]